MSATTKSLCRIVYRYTSQEVDPFGSKTSIQVIYMHITTCSVSSGMSINYIQEYVSIKISWRLNVMFISSCHCLFLTLYWFLVPLYKCLPEDCDLSLKHVCVCVCGWFVILYKSCALVGVCGWLSWIRFSVLWANILTFWRWNYFFFNFSTSCI